MRSIPALLILTLLFASCEKEKIVIQEKEVIREVEKQYRWKRHSRFQYTDAVQLNSFATPNRLYFMGRGVFSSLVADGFSHPDALGSSSLVHYRSNANEPGETKPPICEDYFIQYNNQHAWISFVSTATPVMAGSNSDLKLSEIDTTFRTFDFFHFTRGECIGINSAKQALIPYRSNRFNELRLLLVDTEKQLIDNDYYRVNNLNHRIITVPDEYYGWIGLYTVNDLFFVAGNTGGIYRITGNGELTKVLNKILYNIVEEGGIMYGIGNGQMYTSYDSGISWNAAYELSPDFRILSFTRVNGKIIAYYRAQLFEISPGPNGIGIKELDNDGLDGYQITSVSLLQDKVYLTSLGGVFYKDLAEFFVEKTDAD
jgi:hypothetical protein